MKCTEEARFLEDKTTMSSTQHSAQWVLRLEAKPSPGLEHHYRAHGYSIEASDMWCGFAGFQCNPRQPLP